MDRKTVNLHIGERLKAARRGQNLTLAELSLLCGVSYQQIQKYEAARVTISASSLLRIAEALRVSVAEFFPPAPAEPARTAHLGN